MHAIARRARTVVGVVSLASGCGHASDSGPAASANGPAEQTTFVAYAADFDGYRAWRSLDVFDDGGAGGVVHAATQLVEYTNAARTAPGTPFPVGTIIVKEPATGEPSARRAFAMAKRGAGYNAADGGVSGWEWFELQNVDDAGTVEILWRGIAPPPAEVYAGNVNGDCNGCHAKAPHDGVYEQ